MKRLAILTALILGVTVASVLVAQDEAAQPQSQGGEKPAAADPAAEAALEMLQAGAAAQQVSDADISYALGFIVGSDMKGQGVTIADLNQFTSGLGAALNDKEPRMNEAQINAAMNAYAMKMQQQMRAEFEANQTEGQTFLAENAKKEGVTTTESGLQIKTLKEGTGDAVKAGDIITVNYEGRLLSGEVFDSSDPADPLVWDPRVMRVIPGWVEGVQLMKEGGEYELYVPAELAYGQRQAGDIPPGSTLIFKINVVDTQTPPAGEGAGPMPGQPMP